MHVGIHTLRIWSEFLEVIQHRFLEIHFSDQIISSVRPSGWGGVGGEEGGCHPRHLHNGIYKSPSTKNNISLQKATIAPPPGAKNSFTKMTYASFQTFYASKMLLDPQVDGLLSAGADSILYSIFRSPPSNLFLAVLLFFVIIL